MIKLNEYLEKALRGVPHEEISEQKKNADMEYKARVKEMKSLMSRLHKALTTHAKQQTKDPGNWALVGDMGQVNKLLGEMLEFVGG